MKMLCDITRTSRALALSAAAVACASTSSNTGGGSTPLETSASADEWVAYGHDVYGSRYSPLTQINRDNVSRLTVAWTYHTGEPLATSDMKRSLEVTPLMIGNTLYISTPLGQIIALDPVTGAVKWKYDAKVGLHSGFGDFTTRGVSFSNGRIFAATTDGRLIAINASNGTPIADFGDRGTVDLRRGLRNAPFEFAEYEVTSPPAIVNGLVIVGSAVADNNRTDAASGEVRAYDAGTGQLRWTWDPVPQAASDPAYKTWEGAEAHRTGAANAWSVIVADPQRDLVFVPTSSPSPDYYGGRRLGRNDYASSIVALRASTGNVVWHFQTVHHDLWDYDNASPPLLAIVKGQPAVIQTTKTGMMFVLNRETGAPIFPVEERPVPASTVPGERAWPTQPFSSLPPLSPHGWDGQSPDSACRALTRGLRNDGIFTPPSLEGTIVVPSNIGGAHWGGVAFDPVRQIAVVPVNTLAAAVQLIPIAGVNLDTLRESRSRMGYDYTVMRGTPYIMRRRILFVPPSTPCTPAPPGALVAMDLKSGKKAWSTPILPNLGGAIVTGGGLVFMAATIDRELRAFDIDTGREVWHASLPASGKATPMTYRGADGRQYVVVAAGGDGETWGASDAIVAFALSAP
jgi:quinoprotein glucose dehydrogenase